MKRLNCTYELKKDPIYPWLLKHPKIKIGLAKFKTRQEALQWYMNLEFDTAVWFQNDENIWDGQLTIDSDENKEWFYYVKTAGFDGGATYNGVCSELDINPSSFKYERADKKKFLEKLDYILISNPATYFPTKLEISKKAHKKEVVDIEAIRAQFQEQINLLLLQISHNNKEADRELELLKEELAKKDANFDELAKRMELLRQGNAAKPLEGVHYVTYLDLNHDDYVGALVLYNEKLRNILETTAEQKISKYDLTRIQKNYDDFNEKLNEVEKDPEFKNQKLLTKLRDELNLLWSQLMSKFKVDNRLKDEPIHNAYYFNKTLKNNQSIAWDTSFVLVDLMHVGFVPKDRYHYAIPYLATKTKYAITVINENDSTQTITIKSKEHEVPKEKNVPVVALRKQQIVEQEQNPIIYPETKPVEEIKVQKAKEEIVEQEQNPIIYPETKPVEEIKVQKAKEEIVEQEQNPIIYPEEKEVKLKKVNKVLIEEVTEKPIIYMTPLDDNHIVIKAPKEEKSLEAPLMIDKESKNISKEKEIVDIKVLKDTNEEKTFVEEKTPEISEEIIYVQHPKETIKNVYASNNLDSEFVVDEEVPVEEEKTEESNNEELPKNVEKEIKKALHPHRGWTYFWIFVLVLILIGVIVVNILAIIQLAGGFITFP